MTISDSVKADSVGSEATLRWIAEILDAALLSTAEYSRQGEPANIVDGLFAVARAIQGIADRIGEAPLRELVTAINNKDGYPR